MSGICGWVGAPLANAEAVIGEMLGRLPAEDSSRRIVAVGAQGALAVLGSAKAASLVQNEHYRLAVLGHPRYEGVPPGRNALDEFARQFLIHYEASGPRALDGVRGDFSLVLVDKELGQAFLAVDRMGVRNLAYEAAGGALLFGSTLDACSPHPLAARRIDPQAIFNYLYFHMVPGPGTVYQSALRVPPGHFVRFQDGAAAVHRYWRIVYAERPPESESELKEALVSTLREATTRAADGDACGAFLSGGTDSSTITGMLGLVTGAKPKTYSIGFDAAGYDEMAFARIAARHFAADHHEYYVTPRDVVDAIPRIADAYDQPFGNASAVPTYYCARLAKEDGVARLLGGDGGDELFGGNARYAKQHQLALYHRLPEPVRRGLIEPLALASVTARVPGLRKVRSYIEQARLPLPARYEAYNLLDRLGPNRVFTGDFLASVDPGRPRAMLEEAFNQVGADSLINQMLGIDLKFTLADNDLPKVTRMCGLAGVEVAFPMLDEAVVDLSAALPPAFKLRGQQLRYFFKEALKNFLPAEIIAKRKHGFGLPVGPWLRDHPQLGELARSSVDGLRQRGIVDPRFIDHLWDEALPRHPAYFGAMIWTLMMLALWFEKRQP